MTTRQEFGDLPHNNQDNLRRVVKKRLSRVDPEKPLEFFDDAELMHTLNTPEVKALGVYTYSKLPSYYRIVFGEK